MNDINQRINEIIENEIVNVYSLDVSKNFDDILLNNIYLQEKFREEEIKTFRLAKILSFYILGTIIFGIFIVFSFAIKPENLESDSPINEFLSYVNDFIKYVFSIYGVRLESGFILLVAFVVIIVFLYFEKFFQKVRSNRN